MHEIPRMQTKMSPQPASATVWIQREWSPNSKRRQGKCDFGKMASSSLKLANTMPLTHCLQDHLQLHSSEVTHNPGYIQCRETLSATEKTMRFCECWQCLVVLYCILQTVLTCSEMVWGSLKWIKMVWMWPKLTESSLQNTIALESSSDCVKEAPSMHESRRTWKLTCSWTSCRFKCTIL